MKKVRTMLTAIAIFAIAGGALAFKTTKFGNRHYCYTTTNNPQAFCVISVLNRTFTTTNVLTHQWKYTTTNNPNACINLPAQDCTSIGKDGGL